MSDENRPEVGAATAARLRALPAVDRVLARPELLALRERLPAEMTTAAVRSALDDARRSILSGQVENVTVEEIAKSAALAALGSTEPSLRPVINATGVIIHTNLGRAPLSREAVEAVNRAAGYGNLEYELELGARGSRYVHAVGALRRLTRCEDALVVNNNAAGLVLALTALARGREVVVSRGQSVEIGGGFRIPEIMQTSGAKLVEVGTTNRTYTRDYEHAAGPDTALLLRVHSSNFKLVGFTAAPTIDELAAVAHAKGVQLVDDLGSGAMIDTSSFGLAPEPTVQESVAAGADLVLFSGDKLLGGPQCGIIAGRSAPVDQLRRHPLARALRVDKLTLAALEATLLHYLKGEALTAIPVWRMIAMPLERLRDIASSWTERLQAHGIVCSLRGGESAVGGGSLPGETLPTWLVALSPAITAGESSEAAAGRSAARLRLGATPVIARVDRGALLLDPRTVLPGQEDALLAAVETAFTATNES